MDHHMDTTPGCNADRYAVERPHVLSPRSDPCLSIKRSLYSVSRCGTWPSLCLSICARTFLSIRSSAQTPFGEYILQADNPVVMVTHELVDALRKVAGEKGTTIRNLSTKPLTQ